MRNKSLKKIYGCLVRANVNTPWIAEGRKMRGVKYPKRGYVLEGDLWLITIVTPERWVIRYLGQQRRKTDCRVRQMRHIVASEVLFSSRSPILNESYKLVTSSSSIFA